MTLSAELFRQIVDALRSDPTGEREKRNAPRVGLRVHVHVLLDGKPEQLWCRNISASGIGLMHTRALTLGTEFVVCLPAAGLAEPVCISCIVVHCHRQAPERFSIGARILRTLSSEEAAALGITGAAWAGVPRNDEN
jgi:hypothetical protein